MAYACSLPCYDQNINEHILKQIKPNIEGKIKSYFPQIQLSDADAT